MLTSSQLRAKARAALGGQIFSNQWLMALVVCLISMAASLISSIPFVGFIASIVISGAVAFGIQGYFLKLARGQDAELVEVFDGFKNDFVGNFLLGFMQSLFICLWSLLFVIPGIVAAYAYSMAYFIKNDHPEYSWNECIKASKKMMNGNKWRLFCLQLSFIGWHIVAFFIPFGIGSLFVSPYVQTANAVFYEEIKDQNI